MQKIQTYNSPLGNLTLVSNGIALTGIWFEKQKPLQHILNLPHKVCNLPIFDDTKRWLDIYFEGDVPNFTPQLCPEGTHFRQQVWNYLLQIPYGKTTTYGALAKKMAEHLQKQKMSAQAIGGAVGHNPIPIIIPCHRVIGTNGTMTGYASGIWRKEFLLKLESRK